MPSDWAFCVIAVFPVVSAAGFGVAHAVLAAVSGDRSGDALARHALWIHLLLLTIPLGTAWGDGLLRAGPAELGMRLPAVGGLGPALSSAVAVPAAAAAGVVLYCGELLVAVAAHRRRGVLATTPDAAPGNAGRAPVGGGTGFASYMTAAAAIACAEEYVWRGYLTLNFSDRVGLPVLWTLAAASGMFGLHHAALGLRSCLAKTVHGFAWGLMLVTTGSLIPPVVSHTAFQFMVWRRAGRIP